MQAIILAAGMGKRLKELTQNNTKCMVKVNGVSLIDRLLHQLEKEAFANMSEQEIMLLHRLLLQMKENLIKGEKD